MNVLFCNDPFDTKSVDPDYKDEFVAAGDNGFTSHLFSFEILTKDENSLSAIKWIKASGTLETIIYRGWMLKPKQYASLYEALLTKNYKLVNSPIEYQNCHYLPNSYRFIEGQTPETVWLTTENQRVDFNKVFESIERFKNAPLVVKDFVKSQKHYWDTACFIPSASDKDNVKSVVTKFLDLQGNDLNEGLVFRAFVELKELTTHSKSGMPLKQEYRLFFLGGKLLSCYNYWEEGKYAADEQPPLHFYTGIAKKISSNFFSMDVAKTKKDDWVIIELGDGQVAGLPDKESRFRFYQSIKELNGS